MRGAREGRGRSIPWYCSLVQIAAEKITRLYPGGVIIPQEGRPPGVDSVQAGRVTSCSRRPSGTPAAWRLGARMPRPGTRGKRRQVAERGLADLPLTRQLRSAGASSTASPQRRRRRPKQTCRLHDGGFGRRVWCADCPQLPSPTTPRLSCPCAPIPSPQTTLTHLPPRHSRRRRRHCPRQHQLTSAFQLLRR